MRKTVTLKLASVALLSMAMVGCASTQMAPRASISASDTAASHVEAALAKRDFAGALMHAERLVAARPSLTVSDVSRDARRKALPPARYEG